MKPACSLLALTAPLVFGLLAMPAGAEEQRVMSYLPQDQLYPTYVADPLRTNFSAQSHYYSNTTIPETSRRRFGLKMGGQLGLLRSHPPEDQNRGWQITLGAGFLGHFDAEHLEDNLGWDGVYALSFEQRFNPDFAYRVGIHHVSAHLGDEYLLRTNRERVDYTRQEIRMGVAGSIAERWQLYGDIGNAPFLSSKPQQKAWRYQTGIQYENSTYFYPWLGLYVGFDLSSYEENDWDLNKSLQFGWVVPSGERRWRLGIEAYEGRTQLGEFFLEEDRYTGIGLWLDM